MPDSSQQAKNPAALVVRRVGVVGLIAVLVMAPVLVLMFKPSGSPAAPAS